MLTIEKATSPGASASNASAARPVEAAPNSPRSKSSRTIGTASVMSSTVASPFTTTRYDSPCPNVARNSGSFFSTASPDKVVSK